MPSPQEHLEARLRELITGAGLLALQATKDRKFGDVSLACFPLAQARRMAPAAVAAELAAAFAPDTVIESVTATGPFINFRYRRSALARHVVTGVLEGRPPFGPADANGVSVVIDFSSPNVAKPFHMGHLRSTVIGAALRRLYLHRGYEVHGINHLGDWGAQFGKVMVAWREWGDEAELARRPMRHLHSIYVRINNELKAGNPALETAAAHAFQRLEAGEPEERALWQKLRDVSLSAFDVAYRRLGIEFDHVAGESFYEDKMEDTIARLQTAGVTSVSDGALVVDLEAEGMPPCILRKSDGTTIYATRDLAALFYRRAHYRFAKALYVVGGEQKLHFAQLKAVLEKLGWPEAAGVEHVNFGLILTYDAERGRWAKMSSRKGSSASSTVDAASADGAEAATDAETDTIFLEELLDEAVSSIEKIVEAKNPDLPDKRAVAEQVGVSAIVFNDLKNSRIKDVKFDWAQILNFDGETGPYVQFAGARLASILEKAGVEDRRQLSTKGIDFEHLADADQVLLTMLEFGPAVDRAIEHNEPSVITNLMIRLAGDIHAYLRDHNVIQAEGALRDARIVLVAAARRLLEIGLGLIGVAAPEHM